jgi:hypothetical protein
MPPSDGPQAPTIQDIKDLAEKRIAAIRGELNKADDALEDLEDANKAKSEELEEAKAAGDAKKIRRLTRDYEALVVENAKAEQVLVTKKAALEAQIQELEKPNPELEQLQSGTGE